MVFMLGEEREKHYTTIRKMGDAEGILSLEL